MSNLNEIRIRKNRPCDFEWIAPRFLQRRLEIVPPTRGASQEAILKKAEEDFQSLKAQVDGYHWLVAVNENDEPLGFLLLNVHHQSTATGEKQSRIELLSAEHTEVRQRLTHRAAQVTGDHGLRFMTKVISVSEQKILDEALACGYKIERYGYAMGCTSKGPGPMPGSLKSER